jgi:hypothetical protein
MECQEQNQAQNLVSYLHAQAWRVVQAIGLLEWQVCVGEELS